MRKEMTDHECKNNHFTIIVLKLQEKRVKELLSHNQHSIILVELAELFHGLIYPEHNIEELHKLEHFSRSNSKRYFF